MGSKRMKAIAKRLALSLGYEIRRGTFLLAPLQLENWPRCVGPRDAYQASV